jgi:hypothetical protein
MELAALDHGDLRGMRKVAASLIKEALKGNIAAVKELPIESMAMRYSSTTSIWKSGLQAPRTGLSSSGNSRKLRFTVLELRPAGSVGRCVRRLCKPNPPTPGDFVGVKLRYPVPVPLACVGQTHRSQLPSDKTPRRQSGINNQYQ